MSSWANEALYRAQLASGWDGLRTRTKPSLRGRSSDRVLLDRIDDMLLDIWEGDEQPAKPAAKLWRLNCLLYSGAVMAVTLVTHLADSEDDSDLVRDVSEEEEWNLTFAPRGDLHPDGGRRSSALEAREVTLGRLRK